MPKQHDFTMKYDQVLEIRIFINTDRELKDVAAALVKAARGPRRDASVAMCGEYTGAKAREVWGALARAASDSAADPRTTEVDEDWKEIED